MPAVTAMQATPRFQFETSSGSLDASQKVNCGPTSICFIGGFYGDNMPAIENTRRRVMACCIGTSCYQQQQMLANLGVPASVLTVTSIAQMRALAANGMRPYAIRVLMSRVPASVRDHPFLGWHMMAVIAAPAGGFWVNDPDFSPPGGYRPDPDKGHKWYSDAVMKYAFIDNPPAFVVAPNAPKKIPDPVVTTLATYSPARTAHIAGHTTVYGYDPKRPGGPVAKFVADADGSAFPVTKKQSVAWAKPYQDTVPHGSPFLLGSAGVFAGLLVVASAVTAQDGKPW